MMHLQDIDLGPKLLNVGNLHSFSGHLRKTEKLNRCRTAQVNITFRGRNDTVEFRATTAPPLKVTGGLENDDTVLPRSELP